MKSTTTFQYISINIHTFHHTPIVSLFKRCNYLTLFLKFFILFKLTFRLADSLIFLPRDAYLWLFNTLEYKFGSIRAILIGDCRHETTDSNSPFPHFPATWFALNKYLFTSRQSNTSLRPFFKELLALFLEFVDERNEVDHYISSWILPMVSLTVHFRNINHRETTWVPRDGGSWWLLTDSFRVNRELIYQIWYLNFNYQNAINYFAISISLMRK